MIDTDRYTEDIDETCNLIMNIMDDVEREFEIKTRIRLSNKMKAAIDKLDTEVKRLREQLAKANKYVHSICQHSDSMLMDYEDYMKGDD
tara:strand:+ start:380 stop:646 length:267 start_codon:yes stop_codon:yes gene_type:complete